LSRETVVAALSWYGEQAAEHLIEHFIDGTDGGKPTPMTWDNQRWIRYRSTTALLQQFLGCSHYGAPLNQGKIVGRAIECPWHASRFALEDGGVVQGPACAGVPAYDCRIVNDQVQVKLRQ
jgi:Rieske Fe-S protein